MLSKLKDNSAMITVESLIVFPMILMIVFVFSSLMLLEFEKSYLILSSNQFGLEVVSYDKDKPADNNFRNVEIKKTPFTESISIKEDVRFTSEVMPKWTTIDLSYRNKSTYFNRFNVLILKEALYDAFVNDGGGEY